VASEFPFRFFCDRFVDFHRVIVKEFLAGFDITHRVDEDAVIFLNGLAVWVAAMVDAARVVAANLWIDYFAVFKAEIEGVRVVFVVGSGFPGNALAGVFDNASAFANEMRGINAATVHGGLPNFDSYGSVSRFAFIRHVLGTKQEVWEN
jgi:hypothetical protein